VGRKIPDISLAARRLIRDAAVRIPELGHIRASRILVVGGEARRASRATIRPSHFEESRGREGKGGRSRKPLIKVKGKKILYVITLRPLWFVGSTPEQRVATLLHELYHISIRFDGTLHGGRRHARISARLFSRRVRVLCDRYLAEAPDEVVAPFAREGEVRISMWLEKPVSAYQVGKYKGRRTYTERELFQGTMPMRNRS
jgi:hypothetical protein